MPGNADKHAPVLSILCCARRIHVLFELPGRVVQLIVYNSAVHVSVQCGFTIMGDGPTCPPLCFFTNLGVGFQGSASLFAGVCLSGIERRLVKESTGFCRACMQFVLELV